MIFNWVFIFLSFLLFSLVWMKIFRAFENVGSFSIIPIDWRYSFDFNFVSHICEHTLHYTSFESERKRERENLWFCYDLALAQRFWLPWMSIFQFDASKAGRCGCYVQKIYDRLYRIPCVNCLFVHWHGTPLDFDVD